MEYPEAGQETEAPDYAMNAKMGMTGVGRIKKRTLRENLVASRQYHNDQVTKIDKVLEMLDKAPEFEKLQDLLAEVR